MSCRQVENWMDAALDGDLAPDRRARLDAHLQSCAGCRRQWEALCTAEQALRTPLPVSAPEGLLVEFRQRLAVQKTPARPPRRAFLSWLVPVGSLAAASAAAAVIVALNAQAPPVPFTLGEPRSKQLARNPELRRSNRSAAKNSELDLRWFGRPSMEAAAPSPPTAAPQPAPAAVRPPGPLMAYGKPVRLDAERPLTLGLPDGVTESYDRKTDLAKTHQKSLDQDFALAAPRPFAATGERLQVAPLARVRTAPEQAGGGLGGSEFGGGFGFGGGRMADSTQLGASLSPARPGVPGQAGRQSNHLSFGMYAAGAPEPLGRELDVSPALLTALQRPVNVRLTGGSVQAAADQLTLAADVELQVDPKIANLRVSVQNTDAPLWKVLESVAHQGNLRIYPENNQLILRAAEPQSVAQAEKPEAPRGAGAAAKRFRNTAALKVPSVQQQTLSARAPQAPQAGKKLEAEGSVWAAEWGRLPERGFQLPTPEELPALEQQGPRLQLEELSAPGVLFRTTPRNNLQRKK